MESNVDDTDGSSARSTATWTTPLILVAVGVAIAVRAYFEASSATEGSLPWILLMIATWTGALMVVVVRRPRRELRFSDPCVLVLLWAAYYFIVPALSWLSSATFALDGTTVTLTNELVNQVQQMHVLFLLSLITAYVLVLPRFGIRPLRRDQVALLPSAKWWIIFGLLPTGVEIIARLVQTGSIRPETSYLDAMSDFQSNVDTTRSAGGADYIVTQIFVKLAFYGSLALAFGLSLYLVKAWQRKQWWRIVGFHAAFPVLLYLSVGARSTVAFPFIIALIVTDYLSGPIRWRYILTLVIAGFSFFYLYGFFRLYQDEDLGSAIAHAAADVGETRELDLAEAENSLMLLKEAYAIQLVEQEGAHGIVKDLENALLLSVPEQIATEKEKTVSELLSRDLIGDRLFEEGFALAGSLVAEGFLAGGPFGVVFIAAILGCLIGGSARLLARGKRGAGVPLWRVMLLAALVSQAVMFIRSELGLLISYYLYYVFVPMILAYLLLRRAAPDTRARWCLWVYQVAP